MYNRGKVVVGAASRTKNNFEDLEQMEDAAFEIFIDSNDIDCYSPDEFVDGFIDKVKADDTILHSIYNMWNKYDIKVRDAKYNKLEFPALSSIY